MKHLQQLRNMSKDELVNYLYNRHIGDCADYSDFDKEQDKDKHDHGKRIPYIGWFWRDPDFIKKDVSIGICGSYVGVMENNKWGYPERLMTEQEVDTFIDYLDRAFAEKAKGGWVHETEAKAEIVFNELWDWFQTLRNTGKWIREEDYEAR